MTKRPKLNRRPQTMPKPMPSPDFGTISYLQAFCRRRNFIPCDYIVGTQRVTA